LMEYPYDCNEQIFSRYYANALAGHIANSNPRIQEVFNQWRNSDALLSNLEKNEELKNILIQETPWLRDAQSETEQKKRIALLFDLNKMTNELASAKRKLQNNQMDNGAWPWFEGGPNNRYITQHIITGFGHLKHLNVTGQTVQPESKTDDMVVKAIKYLDDEFVKEYKELKKYNKNVDLSKDHLSNTQLHYLYMRSFFPEIEKSKEAKSIAAYYQTQIQKYWLSRPLYAKGLMALVSHRTGDNTMANKIMKSLQENSITNDELGMYWKDNKPTWYWYQAPIETQALMIEAFGEIQNDVKTIDNLKIWLLKNKQTNSWSTTKATANAIYALLLRGSDWLKITDAVEVLVAGQTITPSKLENTKVEAGTGYFKTSWDGSEVKPEMATVSMTKKGDGIAWGALYWQYFEDLDKITTAETPLRLGKKLFLKTNTDHGEKISEINADTKLKVGDLVRVRIELRSDRDMEFVHMKDMRAAGFEPINVLSRYKWQDGLGYYESTKDAATNFFFDYLPKGTYVFEYDLRINNAGNMGNGITTVQSMYAPEFSSHSEGTRVLVE
ncbi:MAG TPA: alpha-2-macroglobulin, partial [Aquaticitalea sp.]|nr:alpha-2-macroglobulin [Aquaticitalea sp.]